ncbi:MAG TPA: hypothetical protein VFF33_07670 [Ignavibacteriaceae bacterium]|nr:hypothetical protein [Ignavibacteriaceae bacterium]
MSYRSCIAHSRKELKDFLNLPYIVYAEDNNWITPLLSETKRILDKKVNPYFRNADIIFFNCYKDNSIASRTIIVLNKEYEKKLGKSTAIFGFFESINDEEAAKNLFEYVFKYCKEKGVQQIIGPFNPNHYSELGIQISDFQEPASFFQTYNPEYYCPLLTKCGFVISKKLHIRKNPNISEYLEKIYGDKEIVVPDGYSLRIFNADKKEEELENLRGIYNDAFEDNVYFIPVNKEEYIFSSKYISLVTDPDMLIFAEYKNEPVGVIQFCYDINPLLKNFKGRIGPLKYLKFMKEKKNINTIIFYAVGIKKAHRNSKVIRLLLKASIHLLKKYKNLETTWMTYDNLLAIKAAEHLGLHPGKEFAILRYDL